MQTHPALKTMFKKADLSKYVVAGAVKEPNNVSSFYSYHRPFLLSTLVRATTSTKVSQRYRCMNQTEFMDRNLYMCSTLRMDSKTVFHTL